MCLKKTASLAAMVCLISPTLSYGLGQQFQLTVTGSRVNVRAEPTTSSDVLFQVSRGESLDLVEEVGNWYLVQTAESKRGYIFEQLVELSKLAPGLIGQNEASATAEPIPEVEVVIHEDELPRLGPMHEATVESPSTPASPVEVEETEQELSPAQQQKRRGLYKLIGGAAGIATGAAVMGSSKPAGIGLMGVGGFFAWNGYNDRKQGERRLQWGLLLQMDRDTKAVAYHMNW